MKIGYARCSTDDQRLDRQLDQLKEYGCERLYTEKMTGTKMDRPELERLLDALRQGDTVVVSDLTRLSRSTKDLFSLADRIHEAGADLKSLKEAWLDTTTPQGKFVFTVFAGVSQLERDLIAERTREGLRSARSRGRLGGRPKIDERLIKQAITLYRADIPVNEICETTGIARATLYKYLRAVQKTSDVSKSA